jgi:hypothetical protein
MAGDLFQRIVSLWDVEQAVVGTLRTWMPTYLAEIERERGLQPRSLERPPAPESYHGGTAEAIAWDQAHLPEVVVVVEPTGTPELAASAGYVQAYEVQVWCIVMGDDGAQSAPGATNAEDSARMQASHYGAASMLLVQHGDLEGFAERTVMVGAPRVECPEPEKRRQQAATTTFHVWVPPIITEMGGPVGPNPQESPGYGGDPEAPFGDAPTVQSSDVTVVAEPIDS